MDLGVGTYGGLGVGVGSGRGGIGLRASGGRRRVSGSGLRVGGGGLRARGGRGGGGGGLRANGGRGGGLRASGGRDGGLGASRGRDGGLGASRGRGGGRLSGGGLDGGRRGLGRVTGYGRGPGDLQVGHGPRIGCGLKIRVRRERSRAALHVPRLGRPKIGEHTRGGNRASPDRGRAGRSGLVLRLCLRNRRLPGLRLPGLRLRGLRGHRLLHVGLRCGRLRLTEQLTPLDCSTYTQRQQGDPTDANRQVDEQQLACDHTSDQQTDRHDNEKRTEADHMRSPSGSCRSLLPTGAREGLPALARGRSVTVTETPGMRHDLGDAVLTRTLTAVTRATLGERGRHRR